MANSSDNRCILGIDPGLKGALAFYFTDYPERVSVKDMPVVDRKVNGSLIRDLLEQLRPDIAIIEQAGPRGLDGAAAAFGNGHNYGVLLGVVQTMRIPYRLVTPAVWKRYFRLDSDKAKSLALAIATFTQTTEHFARKMDEGRAEAALIARYGAEVLLGVVA